MKKRNIPRHIGDSFKLFYLDIYGLVFMIFPFILMITSIAKFDKYLIPTTIINIFVLTASFLAVAENPIKRQRGIELFFKFAKYQYLKDRHLKVKNKKSLSFKKGTEASD